MSRVVMPNLFAAWSGAVQIQGGTGVALRWMLHPSMGLPREHFRVWMWKGGALKTDRVVFRVSHLSAQDTLVTWPGEPLAAAVRVTLTVPTGRTATVSAHSGPAGSGNVVDDETVTGAAAALQVLLTGSSIASVRVRGEATVTGVATAPLQELVDSELWVLIDQVGLPVDARFAGEYTLAPQGEAGAEQDPVSAAITRVKRGTPTVHWAATTDGGRPTPEYETPDAAVLVTRELAPLIDHLAALVAAESDRSRQAEVTITVPLPAPASVHGVDAPDRWQDQSSGAVRPLASMLLAAGADPYAALALGLGTTVGAQPGGLAASRPLFMVTLEHEVKLDVDLGAIHVQLPFAGELAALVPRTDVTVPAAPAGLRAEAPPPPRGRLDRPAAVDQPWLGIVELSWAAPLRAAASDITATGYAVLQSTGPADPALALDRRAAGGHRPFVAAPATAEPTRVSFSRSGIPEPFPGEPTDMIFSVAGHDWFGRWGPWRSAEHTRVAVAPQIPAVRQVLLSLANIGAGPAGSATVEFTWDWSNRTPETVQLRLRLHDEADPPPLVDGSVLSVGGAAAPDLVVDFTTATPDVPPVGVTELDDERAGALRTYRVEIPNVTVAFAATPRIRASVQARASERVRPGVHGAWSALSAATAVSPIPPPAPFVPAAMQWASLPGPDGVSRATLSWSGSAPSYSVYLADETAVARELGLPSPPLDVPPADRLVPLRAENLGAARRAFRRIAENLTAPRLTVELPRGSRLIHFYGIAPTSGTGVERALPAAANSYVAIAEPRLAVPEVPVLVARPDGGGVRLQVRVADEPVAVGRVEITRVDSPLLAGEYQAAGLPILVADAATAIRAGTELVWELVDPGPVPSWTPVFYRAVAWAAEDPAAGVLAGRSDPTGSFQIVVAAPDPPVLTDLRVEPDGSPTDWIASFLADVPRLRTPRGVHRFSLTSVALEAATPTQPVSLTLRADADRIPLLTGSLPAPATAPPLFLHRASVGDPPRVTARLAGTLTTVVGQATDPIGRSARKVWPAPP